MTKHMIGKFRDQLAIFLSALCVIQCLLLPFVVTLIPFLDIWWLSDHFLHPFLLIFVAPLTFYALMPARAKHGSNTPLKFAIPGLTLLLAGVFMEQTIAEKVMTVIGACLLAMAHIKNILLSQKLRQDSFRTPTIDTSL